MYQVKIIDNFDLSTVDDHLLTASETASPDVILVRSSQVPDRFITPRLLLIARSGIGTNTINLTASTTNGTAVFNTPGANANAVKELIIQCLFQAVRPLSQAIRETAKLTADPLQPAAEQQRQVFIGSELYGKTIGIIGLGTIGQRLADTCYHLGLQVVGYNRSPKNLQHVRQVANIAEVLTQADFVVLLLPLTTKTSRIIDGPKLALMRPSATLLNFGRGELVDNSAVVQAVQDRQLKAYITDFPHRDLQNIPHIWQLPHLGGNTREALSHSTNLTFQNTQDFLTAGTVRASVNFPTADLPFTSPDRLTLFFKDRPGFWAEVDSLLTQNHIPVEEMVVNTRDSVGYILMNTTLSLAQRQHWTTLRQALMAVSGMIRVRLLANASAPFSPSI